MRKRKGSSTIGIGVIGLGWGQWHINNYRSLKDVRVMAVCDVNQKHMVEVAKKHNIKHTYQRVTDLLRNPEVDAVSVVIPNYLHAPIVKAALKAGKHVLCEKPLANTVKNGEAIVKAAEKSRQTVMLGMSYRFSAEAHYIRGLLKRGALGKVYAGFNYFLRAMGGIPRPGSWFTTKRMSGGGTLIDIGVHSLDLNWHLMGCPKPVATFGKTYAKFGPKLTCRGCIDVEDLASGFITFANDASIYVSTSWALATKEAFNRIAIFGTKGSATIWPFSVTQVHKGKAVDKTPKSLPKSYPGEFSHFIDCIRTGRRSTISPVTQGLTMLKMIDAIYRSHASGGLVRIK